MKKIKIAQLISRLDRGGAPDLVRIIFLRLDRRRYQVKLISGYTTCPSLETSRVLKNSAEEIWYIPQLKREISPLNDIVGLVKLYWLFRKENFDIVHTHTAKAGVLGRMAAWLAGVPVIIHSPHGHNFYGYFGPLGSRLVVILEKIMARFTDKIVSFTELEKRDLAAFKVMPAVKMAVINSGLDLEPYRKVNSEAVARKKEELRIKPDTVLVGMAGRLEPVKGPEYFIKAAKLILAKYPEVRFLVVGEGSLRRELENKCRELNISESFIFTGWREDIPELLSILDIMVLPSLNEAVGRILIEAGACGIPVVATRVGGVPEIVKDNETGILVPAADAQALARGIILLLEDKEKRLKMGRAASKWVDDKFSAEVMVNKISNFYEELAKR